jgi:GR25 family glycosyltransferase involved in LPS biosynthesis
MDKGGFGMTVNEFFGKVYYINLDKRRDRRECMVKALAANGITAVRMPALNGNKWGWKSDQYNPPLKAFEGVAGGTSTQITILRKAILNEVPSVLILEDDCEFVTHFAEKFRDWSVHVPKDWDLLYLGGLNGKGSYVKGIEEHVVSVTGMMSTHAYAVNGKALSKVYNTMYGGFPYLRESADGYLRILQEELNAYAFNPPMVWQKADHSDIQHGHRDYVERFKQPLV